MPEIRIDRPKSRVTLGCGSDASGIHAESGRPSATFDATNSVGFGGVHASLPAARVELAVSCVGTSGPSACRGRVLNVVVVVDRSWVVRVVLVGLVVSTGVTSWWLLLRAVREAATARDEEQHDEAADPPRPVVGLGAGRRDGGARLGDRQLGGRRRCCRRGSGRGGHRHGCGRRRGGRWCRRWCGRRGCDRRRDERLSRRLAVARAVRVAAVGAVVAVVARAVRVVWVAVVARAVPVVQVAVVAVAVPVVQVAVARAVREA